MQEYRSTAPDIDSHGGQVPRHVAIIMDGNNRWARQRDLPGHEGHRAGEEAVQRVVRGCIRQGIRVLTLFAFSSENWRRPADEVQQLMALFMQALTGRLDELVRNGVRLRFIGDRSAFSPALQEAMAAAEARTRQADRLTLVIAANYGGQWDIAESARRIAERVAAGELDPARITTETVQQHISLNDLPLPDLLIRTGAECRLSNFLLWQAAYSELYFSPQLWPDFDERSLLDAVRDYAGRQRRFGRSGEDEAVKKGKDGC